MINYPEIIKHQIKLETDKYRVIIEQKEIVEDDRIEVILDVTEKIKNPFSKLLRTNHKRKKRRELEIYDGSEIIGLTEVNTSILGDTLNVGVAYENDRESVKKYDLRTCKELKDIK